MPLKPKRISEGTYLFALFLITVLAKAYISLQFLTPRVIPDEIVYGYVARSIGAGRFVGGIQYAQSYPFGYPLFLSLASISSNPELSYHIMLFINCIISSSIIFPAYFILKKFINKKEVLYFSALVSLLPPSSVYFPLLMSENLFIPLFLFSSWFLLESVSRKTLLFDFLSGLSISLLFLTRIPGAAMVIGIILAIAYSFIKSPKNRSYWEILKNKTVMVLSFVIPFGVWCYHNLGSTTEEGSTQLLSGVTGYDISYYTHNLVESFTNFPSFITFLNLSIHEVDFLILTTYVVFFVLAIYSLHKRGNIIKRDEYLFFTSYTLFSSALLILITVMHMYGAAVVGDEAYLLFGRYLDPLVPPIFIMGAVGFERFRKDKDRKSAPSLIGIYLLVLLTLLLTFPYGSELRFSNIFTISYVQVLRPSSTGLFFIIASLIPLSLMLLSRKNQNFVRILQVLLVSYTLLINLFVLFVLLSSSTERESVNQISRYLQRHSTENTLTMMDAKDLQFYPDRVIWFSAVFWSRSQFILQQLDSADPCSYNTKTDYLISNKSLHYEIAATAAGYNLYNLSCKT